MCFFLFGYSMLMLSCLLLCNPNTFVLLHVNALLSFCCMCVVFCVQTVELAEWRPCMGLHRGLAISHTPPDNSSHLESSQPRLMLGASTPGRRRPLSRAHRLTDPLTQGMWDSQALDFHNVRFAGSVSGLWSNAGRAIQVSRVPGKNTPRMLQLKFVTGFRTVSAQTFISSSVSDLITARDQAREK